MAQGRKRKSWEEASSQHIGMIQANNNTSYPFKWWLTEFGYSLYVSVAFSSTPVIIYFQVASLSSRLVATALNIYALHRNSVSPNLK